MNMTKFHPIKKKEDSPFSFLGKGISFAGKIKSKGTMSIDGHFTGDLSSIENLIVGKDAVIEANLEVSSAILYGEIHGNINACGKIEIFSTGRVYGDILSPVVVMEAGALLDGKCTVTA